MKTFLKRFIKQVEPAVDRRAATRLPVKVPVLYRISNVSRDWKAARALDISASGVRMVMTGNSVEMGSCLELRLKLPKMSHVFELNSTVVWSKAAPEKDKIECGLTFEGVRHLSNKEKMVHVFADKVCALALKHLDEFETHPAASFDELKQAYRLIYKEYLARGYCSEKSSQMHFNYFCVLPETRTFVLSKKKSIVGTISLIQDSPCGLPMESLFPAEIQELRETDRKLAEVSLLSLSKEEFHRKGFSLANLKKLKASLDLFKIMLYYADTVGITDLVIAVHPKHEALYRYLNFEVIGPVRSYDGACGNPALPMRMNVKKFIHAIQGMPLGHYYQAFLDSPASRNIRDHYAWNSKSVEELFKMEPSVVPLIPPKAKIYIENIFPNNRWTYPGN